MILFTIYNLSFIIYNLLLFVYYLFIIDDMNHRPSEALKESKAYISHVERTIKKIEELQEDYDGYLNFHDEKEIMRNRLKLKD